MKRFRVKYRQDSASADGLGSYIRPGKVKLALIEALDTSICRRILIERHPNAVILEISEV